MHLIVLVKQVPDVSRIPETAWDRKKGTLKRALLDNVLNPLDLHALTLAYRMKEQLADPQARIIALSMGPPQAREVLLDAMSRGADEGVLLTDVAFSGADTIATAYTLAQAIRKIEQEVLKSQDYIILSGMQSVDGDTAQVPGQIAEELNIEHISYVQSFEYKELEGAQRLIVKRIGPGGVESVSPLVYPVLLTATACTEPLYRSFHRARDARTHKISEWNAAALKTDPAHIGAKGSRTQVFRIFSPSEDQQKRCVFPKTVDEMLQQIESLYRNPPTRSAVVEAEPYSVDGKTPTYTGEVWVYVEQTHGKIESVSLELISKARELADSLNQKVGAVLVGHQVAGLAPTLIAQGADKVYLTEHPALARFLPMPYKKAVCAWVEREKPQIVLFGATPLGRELAPRVAYHSNAGLTADCTKLDIDDIHKGNISVTAALKQTRPALGGNIMATIMTRDSQIQMASVRPGVMKAEIPDPSREGVVVSQPIEIEAKDIRTQVLSSEPIPEKTKLTDAQILVSGGRALGSKANYDRHVRGLASALQTVLSARVDVGASRAAVEEGMAGHESQVGQTGQTVQPRMYIAVGISGAVQHLSGMQNSEVVIAINKDPKARIFDYADLGMVGDYETIVPELVGLIEARKNQ
ncbi:MAG: FAD-binding protein [Rubrivivax sp.]|nr:FAD-binding protein [Rubrivivax sp.]